MSKENKPCPFCGIDDIHPSSRTKSFNQGFIVICGNCKAEGPLTETRQEALEKWNKRSDEKINKDEKIEDLQNQLIEKDAMIDWLAEQCKSMSDNSWEYCMNSPTDWRKAAQEAVKKND